MEYVPVFVPSAHLRTVLLYVASLLASSATGAKEWSDELLIRLYDESAESTNAVLLSMAKRAGEWVTVPEIAPVLGPNATFRSVDGKTVGLTHFKLEPGFRMPFGHKHTDQEEVYVVVRGSARVKVDDDIVELGEWDAIRFEADAMRNVEAGPDGVEYLAFSAGD